jgi:RNA polymerase sigma factor (sigma-70 family)
MPPLLTDHDALADELLVLRCQLGERPAFDGLVARWAEPVRRHLMRVTGESDVADELTQEVWLRVIQGIGRLREARRFRSWLFGIAHRVLMDRLRLRYSANIDANTDASLIEDAQCDPAGERESAARDVARGLGLLPLIEREVLTLFYLDDLSLTELSQVLDIPIGTVKSRLFRARNLLRQHFLPEEQTP